MISAFDLFSIGIGPSSSHTVGPMRAAKRFLNVLEEKTILEQTEIVKVELFGSLALTGIGHCIDRAILLGLEGETPEECDASQIQKKIDKIRKKKSLFLNGKKPIHFDEAEHLIFCKETFLPFHSNAMQLSAFNANNQLIIRKTYYSVGGGFVVEENEENASSTAKTAVPYPFSTGNELLQLCAEHQISIVEIVWVNELTWRSEEEIKEGMLNIWRVMRDCIERGCHTEGELPGGLKVKRRATKIHKKLSTHLEDPSEIMDWISLYALAVNEENAAGSRVVTAPTNGAAGIIPAVIKYYERFVPFASEQGIVTFLLVASAIGILFKKGASISAAEVGCQGEVGVACSMAAAGLAAVLGGSPEQIENAAEIGMEHNLGLTCDPIGGLVQIPCIERNTMGAVQAVNAARLALHGDGTHKVSLDQVIATMKQTGKDMQSHYKETSQGGLAVNVIEC